MKYSKSRGLTRRLPFYFVIFVIVIVPKFSKQESRPKLDLSEFTMAQFLDARAAPDPGKYFIYLSPAGSVYFGKVRWIEETSEKFKVVLLELDPENVIWCKLNEGIWADFDQLLLSSE